MLQLIKEKLDEINYSDGTEHFTSIINRRNFDRVFGLVDKSKIFRAEQAMKKLYTSNPLF